MKAETLGEQSYVYLIGSPNGGLVKIGTTINLAKRLRSIQLMSPDGIEVLWRANGGRAMESALHEHFARHRSHGEWFDFGDQDAVELVREAAAALAGTPPPAKPVPTGNSRPLTLSVRKADVGVWAMAKVAAQRKRVPLSGFVADAIQEYLGSGDGVMLARLRDQNDGSYYTRSIEGDWLTDPDERSGDTPARAAVRQPDRFSMAGSPTEWRSGVGRTAEGCFIVYLHHWNPDFDHYPELWTFSNLDEAEEKLGNDLRIERSTWKAARRSGPVSTSSLPVVWRDI